MEEKALKNSDKLIEKIKNSVLFRIALIGTLILILLIPSFMIKGLIEERKKRRMAVINEISSKWAYSQVILGPVLDVPYKDYIEETVTDKNGKITTKIKEIIKTAHFLPEDIIIEGKLIPQVRYRGIYKAIVYTAILSINGNFIKPDFKKLEISEENILWDRAGLSFGINDMRGISKSIVINWNEEEIVPEPGVKNKDIITAGINTKVNILETNKFSMELDIRGSQQIDFIPIGRNTIVKLQSSWEKPSFNGLFLPVNETVDEKGFIAEWNIFDYNREFPQYWSGSEWNIYNSKFGVELFTPVDEYQKTTRSNKYSILFIFLTFLAFFIIIELVNKKRIHPIQYLLVGVALILFYLLLLALSEHIKFDFAYLIAGISIVTVTTVYIRGITGKNLIALIMGLMIAGLFGFLYVIIQLENYALLFGSIGLFIILAFVMIFTRKIDWFDIKLIKKKDE